MANPSYSYEQGQGEVFPLGRTLGDYLAEAAREEPDKMAIICGDRRITFGELGHQVDNLVLGLIKLGLVHGDRIGLCLPDCPEFTYVYFAAARLGLVVSPISIRYRAEEFATILGHGGARAVIVPRESRGVDFVQMMDVLRPRLPNLEFALALGLESDQETAGLVSLDRLVSTDWSWQFPDGFLQQYLQEHPVEADDLLEIAYTSGTTGQPKGAMATHNNRAAAALLNCEAWGARSDDVMVSMSPLTHSIGLHHSQNAAVLRRFTIVYLGQWEPDVALKAAHDHRATLLIGVPAMYIAMMNHPDFNRYDLSRVRLLWCAGSPVPFQVAQALSTAFGAEFSQTYGSTECGGMHSTLAGDPLEVTCASVGPSVRNMETKVMDPHTGRIVPRGTAGEICIRGITRCLGYYNNPEATAQTIDQAGWFHTGDLGVMDETGYLRIIGRIKDMIIRGGQNIYATEMEELLCSYPDVQQAYVVSYPCDYLGERTCAYVVPRTAEARITRDDLEAFFGGRVAKYKIPDRVEVVAGEQLPLTPSGKVLKYRLRETLLEKLGV